MNAPATAPLAGFHTPPRILIPKLVRSRDAWKAKATQRKQQRKALLIRVRDLTASRLRHRRRADGLAQQVEQLRLQLEHAQQQRDQARTERDALQARLAAPSAPLSPTPAPLPPLKKTTR